MATVMVTVEDTIRDRQVKVQLDTLSSCKDALLTIIHNLSLPKRGFLRAKVPYKLFNAATNKRLRGERSLHHYGITEGSVLRLSSNRRGKAVSEALDELLEEILEQVAEELWDRALKRRVKRALKRIRRTDTTGPIVDKFMAAIESPNAAGVLVTAGTTFGISPVVLIGTAAAVLVVGGAVISQRNRSTPPVIDYEDTESETKPDDGEFLALGGEETADEQDTDGDGLLDAEEDEIGTDWRRVDTDSDELWDGEEFLEIGTDPLDDDTDGDGYGDGEEVLDLGTDPLDPDDPGEDESVEPPPREDTDGDGLLDDEENEIGTNERQVDTDRDGLQDGEEFLEIGTDPLDDDTDGDGYGDGEEVLDLGTDPLDPDDPCSPDMAYLGDVTIPDGTVLEPGESFVKTWEIRNDGSCTWNGDYLLVFVDGASLSDADAVPIGSTVSPGGVTTVSVQMNAPQSPGSYRSIWQMLDDNGNLFGDQPYVSIEVEEPEPEGGTISYGQTRSGTLSQGAHHEWTFSGSSGDTVAISLTSSAFDTYLELYDPSGSLVYSDDDSGSNYNSLISGYQLQRSGTYTIVVSSYSGDESGSYSLSLERVESVPEPESDPEPEGGTISYGQTQTGTLSTGAHHEWTFSGFARDTIIISLTSSAFDTYLELYDPSGSLVYSDDDSGSDYNSLISGYQLQRSGTYTIVVSAYSNSESGSYSLSLSRVERSRELEPEPEGGTISYGQTQTGTLSTGAHDGWTFSGSSGDTIAISLTSSTFDTYLELYDPSGSLVISDDDSGSNYNSLISGYRLQRSGTFTIVVSAYSNSESGSYSLYLELQAIPSLSAPSDVFVDFEYVGEAYRPIVYWNNVSGATWYELWVLTRGANEYESLGTTSGSPYESLYGWSSESFPMTFAIRACNNDTCSEYTYREVEAAFQVD